MEFQRSTLTENKDPRGRKQNEQSKIYSKQRRSRRAGNGRIAQPFVAFDGEGVSDLDGSHRYVLMGNSLGDTLTGKSISTARALAWLVWCGQRYHDYIAISFSFNYDVNKILKDLTTDRLDRLHEYHSIWYNQFMVEHQPGKWFYVKDKRNGNSIRIYDIFSYFACSFLKACTQYLGYNQKIEFITSGKDARSSFDESELDTMIKPYMHVELQLMCELAEQLRVYLNEAEIYPTQWYGPGAVATSLMRKFSVRSALPSIVDYPLTEASQYAYYGGRFEQFYTGLYVGKVYSYDIRSAYPYALSRLPNFNRGEWFYNDGNISYDSISDYSVYHIMYHDTVFSPLGIGAVPFRGKAGTIYYSHMVDTWLWGIELKSVIRFAGEDSIQYIEAWEFVPEDELDRPFHFIAELYNKRMEWKAVGKQAQLALKLCINSVYGKLAQRKQADVKNRRGIAPSWHNLQYAGMITATCRSMILDAIGQSPDSILGVETDGLYSVKPLDLPLSENLGDWEAEEYDGMLYVQSGVYWLKQGEEWSKGKVRGIGNNSLTAEDVRELEPELEPIVNTSTNFHGYGKFRAKETWGTWVEESKMVKWGGNGKRRHDISQCPKCNGSGEQLHKLVSTRVMGGMSYKHTLPWLDMEELQIREGEDNGQFGP